MEEDKLSAEKVYQPLKAVSEVFLFVDVNEPDYIQINVNSKPYDWWDTHSY